MKVIEVPIKEKESKPKAVKTPVIIQRIEKVFHIESLPRRQRQGIGLLGIWTVSLATFLLVYGEQINLHEVFFYFIFLVLSMLTVFTIGTKESREVTKETTLSVAKTLPAFFVWGLGTFVLLFTVFMFSGTRITLPSQYAIMRQLLIIIPAETMIFIVFLPAVLDAGISSKIPWLPGWIASAGIFGLMHWVSGAMPLSMAFFAFLMGILWYVMYSAGRMGGGYGQYFGIGSVLALHFVWNVMALSASTIKADPLVVLFKIMGL